MARFEVGTSIESREPRMTVDGGLPVGRHRFRLQVIDSAGNRSRADVVEVVIQRTILRPPEDPVVRPPIRPIVDRPVIDPTPVVNPDITLRPRAPRKPRS